MHALHGFPGDYFSGWPHQTSSQTEVNVALDLGPGGLYNTAIFFVKAARMLVRQMQTLLSSPVKG